MASAIRVGIIGCARILNAHLRGFRILQESGFGDAFHISALCARKEQDALRFRKRGEGPPPRPAPVPVPEDPLCAPHMYLSDLHPDTPPEIYTDYREMLRRAPIDAVCIYTGHDNHHTIAIDAMRAGKHVAVEKPMAITVRAARRMCEVADETGKVLAIDENAHYRPGTRAAAWAVSSGQIGEVQMLYRGGIGGRTHRPDLVAARTPWRQSKLGAGGGPAIDLGVHMFNEVRTICGPVQSVSAVWRVLEPVRRLMDDEDRSVVGEVPNEVDDVFFANFTLANGGIGHLTSARSAHGTTLAVPGGTNIWGSRGALSGGKLYADDGAATDLVEEYHQHASPEQRAAAFPRGITDGFALEQLDWLTAIQQGRPPEMTGAEGMLDLALSYAILESGILGRAVTPEEVLSGAVEEYQREINAHYGL
jgi:predicted dehydrogenase